MLKQSRILVCFAVVVAFCCTTSPAIAATAASGSVSISFKSLAIGIGMQWGKGVLNFQGVDYPFKISGFSVVDVGFTSVNATGTVHNLKAVPDFAGTFTAGAAGIAVGAGAGAATMKNQNDVVMSIKSSKAGIQFTLAAGGVTVTMLPVGDADGDGVSDEKDACLDTPVGVKVDEKGCPFDYDGDGVPYYLDECIETPVEATVDENGCPLDGDGDGIADFMDECPGTPLGMSVDITGCWIAKGLEFETGKWEIEPKYYGLLNKAIAVFQLNPTLTAEIIGHTDNTGSDQFNQELSEKRANSVRDYFIANFISPDRLTARGMGKADPIASNDTAEGRSLNRRIEFVPSMR